MKDSWDLRDEYPFYVPHEGELDPYRERLSPLYREYAKSVSSDSMAIALRSCAYIWWLADLIDARTLVDYGSGFTSYVIREYAKTSGAECWSVDDDEAWLEKTGKFLIEHGHDPTGLLLWEDFLDVPTADLTVYDFGKGDFRERWMPYCLANTNKVCLLDDVHHDGHRAVMETACEKENMQVFTAELWTRDRFNRRAAVAFR
jgi:hypothetical protein